MSRVLAGSSFAILMGFVAGVWINWPDNNRKPEGPTVQDAAGDSVVVYPANELLLNRQSRQSFEVEFALHNPGEETVAIERVKTSCLCTSAELSSQVIEPKRFVLLRVGISDLTGYATSFRQDVEVRTTSGPIRITVAGKLPAPSDILFRPPQIVRTEHRMNDAAHRSPASIVVRVPKKCCKAGDFTEGNCRFPTEMIKDLAVEFTGESPEYWNYRINIEWNDTLHASEDQTLEVTLPCGTIRIPIV